MTKKNANTKRYLKHKHRSIEAIVVVQSQIKRDESFARIKDGCIQVSFHNVCLVVDIPS